MLQDAAAEALGEAVGGREVIDVQVEVHLLLLGAVGPARRHVVRCVFEMLLMSGTMPVMGEAIPIEHPHSRGDFSIHFG